MLKRKLWRDIKGNYGAYLACISVIMIGLTLYTAMSLTYQNVQASVENYYQKYRMADGFAQIVRAPFSLPEDLKKLPGINQASGRLVQDFLVYQASASESTTLRLVSFTNTQTLNNFKVETGHLPTPGARELLVSPAFYQANNYQPGDQLTLIIAGQQVTFQVTGSAISPEYVYEIPNPQTITPNPKTFGIAYIPYQTLASLVGMEGQINDLAFTFDAGVEYTTLKSKLTRKLDPYGLKALYPREDQLSNNILMQKVEGLKAISTTAPNLFLFVAAAIIYIMLRRMVEQQRGQIGLLKAFGYSSWQIISHYLGYAWVVGLVGGLGGGLAGTGLSFMIIKLYRQYFNLPNLTSSISFGYLLSGTLLTLFFTTIAGYQGCKSILGLKPAEAMRPTAPPAGSKTPLERLKLLWQLLNSQAKMALRNIFRSRQRSLFALGGIACAFSLMLAILAMIAATKFFVTFQFEQVELYDLKVGLQKYVDKTEGLSASKALKGVRQVEPLLEIPVTLKHRWLEKNVALLGLPPNADLYQLINTQGQVVTLPADGVVLSSNLADILAVKLGDKIALKLLGGDEQEYQLVVRDIVPLYVGLGAYMNIDAMGKLLSSPPFLSSLLIKADPVQQTKLQKELQKGQNVTVVQDKNKIAAQFEELLATSVVSESILLVFAFITGFAIIYNINLISLSERQRELSTLMVLGMTEREVGRILVIEQAALGVVGMLLGIPLGYGMLKALIEGTKSDVYNIPLLLQPQSILLAGLGTTFFLVIALWRIKIKISSLSMLDVLKEQGD